MYLIAGATGSLGGGIATRLLQQGHPVRAIIRTNSPARTSSRHTDPAALAGLGAELVEADLTEPDTLAGLCDGVSGVVFTASGTKRTPPDTMESVDVAGTEHLSRIAAGAGVGQFVYVSTLGASTTHSSPLFLAKGLAEEAVKNSGVPFTILHPVKFMQDWIGFVLGSQVRESGRIQLVGPGDVATGFIDEADVADAAVAVLGRGECLGETVPLSTEATTYAELAERIGAVRGEPVEWSSIDPGETVDTVDVSIAPMVTGLLGVAAMAAPDDRTFPDTASQLNLNPTTIDEFLTATFG